MSIKRKVVIVTVIIAIAIIICLLGIAFILIFTKSASAQTLNLQYEDGNPVLAEKIILDGRDMSLTSSGKITLEGISLGEHQIIIIIQGLEYSKKFTYKGEDISLTIEKPVKVNVVIWSDIGKTLSNIKVYSDGELKCTTDSSGTCSFNEKPDTHTFRLQGEGLFHQEVQKVTQTTNSFTFKVARKFPVYIDVKDELSGNPVDGAKVYLDGILKGTTSNGKLIIKDITEGSHILRAEYKDVSNTLNLELNSEDQTFGITIDIPKDIMIKVTDILTGNPAKDVEVKLDGAYKGKTSTTGEIKIKDIKKGTYNLDLNYKKSTHSQIIEVTSSKRSFTISIEVPKTITLSIKDSETSKPIVGFSVLLQNSETYRSNYLTDDYGKVDIKDVMPGRYRLEVVNAPKDIHGRSDPSKLIAIGKESQVNVELDMPNPKFEGGIQCSTSWFFDEVGHCTLNLKNIEYGKGLTSEDTSILLFVFIEEFPGNYNLTTSSKHLISIGRLAPGESKDRNIEGLSEFRYGKKEIVIAVILEGWEYTPQNLKEMGISEISPSISEELIQEIIHYCKENPNICIEVTTKIIAGVLKAAA